VCNPAAVKAAEELHARSKGYSTSVPSHGGSLGQLQVYLAVTVDLHSYRETFFSPVELWQWCGSGYGDIRNQDPVTLEGVTVVWYHCIVSFIVTWSLRFDI
jgi:hypothetical protein